MKARQALQGLLVMVLGTLALFAAACGGGGQPEQRTFDLKLTDNVLDPERITVRHEDAVTLQIEAHQTGELHLHGYDITADVESGKVHEMEFVASLEGRFMMTLHPEFASLFQSGILQIGDSFDYTIPDSTMGTHIPYHSHLQSELTGSVMVSHDDGQEGTIEVRISDEGMHPHMVAAAPGATVRWTNESSALQTVHAGSPAEHGHGPEDTGPGDEIQIGVLEVHPR